MKKQISAEKIVAITFGVLVVCFAVVSISFATWTTPNATPPGGNAPAPINVSSIDQVKTGNLGLGTPVATPMTNKLVLTADSSIVSSSLIRLSSGTTGFTGASDYPTAYSIIFDGAAMSSGGNTTKQIDGAKISMVKENTWNENSTNTGANGALVFYTSSGHVTTSALAEQVRIASTGNVGIGTANRTSAKTPSATLDVYSAPASGSPVALFTDASTTSTSAVKAITTAGTSAGYLAGNDGTYTYGVEGTSSVAANPAIYGSNSASSGVAGYFNGRVGIGTATPATNLDINGQIEIEGGSPGSGKVLVSDANGLATWKSLSFPISCKTAKGSDWALQSIDSMDFSTGAITFTCVEMTGKQGATGATGATGSCPSSCQ